MTVEYTPLKSNYGFSSPGFSVDESGNVSINNIVISGNTSILNNISVGGNAVVDGVVIAQNLQIGTTGNSFNIIDDDDSTITLSQSIKNSHLTNLGILEKLEVDGDISVGLSSTNFLSITNGQIIINSIGIGTIDNIDLGQTTPRQAAFTTATSTTQPSASNHLTRKDYVDTKISAFSIAFGA